MSSSKSSTNAFENLSYTFPGSFNSCSSNEEDQKKDITFIFPDENKAKEVTMHKDKAKANASSLVGGFFLCMDDVDSTIKEVAVFETPLKGLLESILFYSILCTVKNGCSPS